MRQSNRKQRGSEKETAPALTPRQQEVLHLITEGHTSRQIATLLKISQQTAEVHRYNLMQRLNVRNVAQLIRQAIVFQYVSKSYPQRETD